jgi:hypothetical protein
MEMTMTMNKKPTATANYSAQYKDPRWQKKRLEILERDRFQCSRCKDKDSTLHVHHIGYIKGKKVWDYRDNQLATLCESCHEEIHIFGAEIEAELLFFNRNWIYDTPFITIHDIRNLILLLNVTDEGIQKLLYDLVFGALDVGLRIEKEVYVQMESFQGEE